jgi:anti-anti-sigma factor
MIFDDDASPPDPDPGLAITIHQQGEAVVLEAAGDVDLRTAAQFLDAVLKIIDEHPSILVIDLAAVTFFGSSGLAVLAHAQCAAGDQIQLRVVAAGPVTRRPLQVTGLDRELAIHPTRQAALATPA